MNNKVNLIDYMGSDNSHALAAWCSTYLNLDVEMPKEVEDRVDTIIDFILDNNKKFRSREELLKYLAGAGHHSPFRFGTFMFSMRRDYATHVHLLKHQVLLEAENCESARYKEVEDKNYIPYDWVESDKYTKEQNIALRVCREKLIELSERGNVFYHQSLNCLTPILGRQRAKETARYFKLLNTQLDGLFKINFAGLMELYKKRGLASPSQREIAHLVEEMVEEVRKTGKFDESLKAYGV